MFKRTDTDWFKKLTSDVTRENVYSWWCWTLYVFLPGQHVFKAIFDPDFSIVMSWLNANAHTHAHTHTDSHTLRHTHSHYIILFMFLSDLCCLRFYFFLCLFVCVLFHYIILVIANVLYMQINKIKYNHPWSHIHLGFFSGSGILWFRGI